MRKVHTSELWLPLCLLAGCLLLWFWLIPQHIAVFGGGAGPGPRFFPQILTLMLAGLAALRLVQVLWLSLAPDPEVTTGSRWRRELAVVVTLLLVYPAVYWLGVLPTCGLLIAWLMWRFRMPGLWRIGGVTVITIALFYLLFVVVASVSLPTGALFDLLP
ncbi:tripartite tricarboxylate transporter TctB family protein [Salinicola lusitanus]|uniref:tripartite tricarboxylate transporter TctB family protein n=1 Tax=Salinicola lusitanus TaxID=1949085 RepID=UPI000DA25EAD|nr:tripartite tricarboxylate transporter TctB family protein [Salinicola lusitanus]